MPLGFAHLKRLLQHTSLNRFHYYCLEFFSQSLFDAQGFSDVDTSVQLIGNPAILRSCLGFAHRTKIYRAEPSVLVFWTPKPFGGAKFINMLVHVQNAVDLIILHENLVFQSCHKQHGTQSMETYASTEGGPP